MSLTIYLTGVRYWPHTTLATPWYRSQPLPVRLVSMTIIGSVFRACVWVLLALACLFRGCVACVACAVNMPSTPPNPTTKQALLFLLVPRHVVVRARRL